MAEHGLGPHNDHTPFYEISNAGPPLYADIGASATAGGESRDALPFLPGAARLILPTTLDFRKNKYAR